MSESAVPLAEKPLLGPAPNFTFSGPILAKWNSLGGATGLLGAARSNDTTGPDGVGHFVRFAKAMLKGKALRNKAATAAFGLAVLLMSHAGHAQWVNRKIGGFPFDAIVGGRDVAGQPLYICRGVYNYTLSEQPGWTHRNDTQCHFSYGGYDYAASNFDYLISTWVPVTGPSNSFPTNAIPLGYENLPLPPPPALGTYAVYRAACRDVFSSSTTPGKYAPDLGGCLSPYGGQEHHATNGFQVLTDPFGEPFPLPAGAAYVGGGISNLNQLPLGPYQAQSMNGAVIPYDAIVGGTDSDGSTLYVCSGYYIDGFHPGKIRANWNECSVSYGGGEHYTANYYALTPYWIPETGNNFACQQGSSPCTPTRPIYAGNDTNGQPLYICRGSISGNTIYYPGKIASSFTGGCSVSVNGREQYVYNYQLLTDGLIPPSPVIR